MSSDSKQAQVRKSKAAPAVQYKVLMIGDSSVGKTSLVSRAAGGKSVALKDLGPTVGVDMRVVTVPLSPPVRLQVWDTAGQERYRSIAQQFFRGAHAIVVVYDVGRRSSFHAVRGWLSSVLAAAEPIIVVLVGNKGDLQPVDRDVLLEEGELLAAELRIPYFETSALTGDGVDELFATVALRLRDPSSRNNADTSSSLEVQAPDALTSTAAKLDANTAKITLQQRVATVDMDSVQARGIQLHEQHERAAARRKACGCG